MTHNWIASVAIWTINDGHQQAPVLLINAIKQFGPNMSAAVQRPKQFFQQSKPFRFITAYERSE